MILTPARAARTREQSPAVQDRIRSLLPEMPSAVARVAEYLLEHPQAPLTLSIGELAEQAGASAATVTRFCRTIGYPGYVELRVGIATDVGRSASRDSWTAEIGGEFGPDDSPEDLLRMLISSHTKALREATSAIDLAVITEVSRRIALSSHVDIYGVVGSAMLAEELQGRLYRIGVPAYAWSEVHSGLTSAAIQDSDTVAIGISTTGRTEETIEMLAEARSCGAFTVAITNDPTSSLAELADRSIVTSIYEQFRPARRPIGQAWPASRARPALPARCPGEFRPVERQAGRVRPCRLLPPAPPSHTATGGGRRGAASSRDGSSAAARRGGRPVTQSAVAPVVSDFANEVSQRLERLPLWLPTEAWTRRSV